MPPIEGRPFLPPPETLAPAEAPAPALAQYRANVAARKLREKNESLASPEIRTVLVRQLKKREYILIRSQSCRILDITDHGSPHPHRDQMHIMGEWTASKRRTEMVLYRDHSVGVSGCPIPEGTVVEVSAGVLEKGDYTFITDAACIITHITKPTLRAHTNAPIHISGIDLVSGTHRCQTLPAPTLLRTSDAPVGPFVPRALATTAATATVVAAAACWKGWYVVVGGRACRVMQVCRAERLLVGGVRFQVLVVGREVGTGERVEGWFEMGEGVRVGRFGVDAGAWGLL